MKPNPTMQTFDKNLKRTGTLIDSFDIQRKRKINSDYEVKFMVPMVSDDYQEKIQIKGHVQDERGQFYVIQSRSRAREGRKLMANIYCNHVMFKLTDFKFPYASYIDEAYGVHISTLTNKITAATGGIFTFQIHDTFDLHDVKKWGEGDCLKALNELVKMYECEVEPDNFVIHIKKKIGTESGLQYRLKKNIVSSSFKDIGESITTRLYGQMKDGRTFIGMDASKLTNEERALLNAIPGTIVNGRLAVNYLISPYASYWASDSVPFFDNEIIEQDIEEPEDLLEAMRRALREQEQPSLEVTISTADLFKIDKTEPIPRLGDTVTCIDPKMDMNKLKARITDLLEYPYSDSQHSQPTISNVNLRDYDDIIADLEKSKNIVDNLFSNGKVRTELFETVAKQVIDDINNSKTELIYPPDGGILAQDKLNPLRQVRLTSAGIGISTDGWNTIRAAITAGGILAEVVVGQFGNFVSMLIGSGNDVTQINTRGIAAGHANFNDAPFQVDMQGNVIANRLTANYATIKNSAFTDGAIVGSSINVGNGKFIVNTMGSVYAEDGDFRGIIRATGGSFAGNIIASGIITGGTIIGALIQTRASGSYPMAEMSNLDNLFAAYLDARNYISVAASYAGSPSLNFYQGGTIKGRLHTLMGSLGIDSIGQLDIVASPGDIRMTVNPGFNLRLPSLGSIYAGSNNLGFELDKKATAGTSTGMSGSANGGIPIGTVFKDVNGVNHVWLGVPLHSHEQRA